MSKPVPKPRSRIPAKQDMSPTPRSMSVDLEDKPPLLPPKPQKRNRIDGQPGMPRSVSMPETENVYQNVKVEKEKIVLQDAGGSPKLQPFSEATNPTSKTIVMERKVVPGQPGMPRSISVPETGNVYQNIKMEMEKIVLQYAEPFSEATNPTSKTIVMERKVVPGQPGMPRSISMPETENVHQNVKKEVEKIVLPYEGSPTNPTSKMTVMERKAVPERVIVTQRSLDEGLQKRLALKQSETKRLTGHKPNLSTPCFSKCMPKETEADEDPEKWWHTVKPWDELSNDHYLLQAKAPKEFGEKAQRVRKAFLFYKYLLSVHGSALQELITELLQISDNLNKVFKGAKIAGITGGAAGAAGVAAAVGGILLAPLTMGASLAVAAVGVGVAAAGGVTGASAAITNKVNNTMDRKKVEKILQDYMAHMEDIEKCVEFINIGVEHLKDYNLSELHGVDREAVKVARVAKVAWGTVGATSAISKSSGLIQGFSVGLDIYFTKNDKQKLKKGSEAKFAKQIRQVAEAMQASLDELMKVKVELELEDI